MQIGLSGFKTHPWISVSRTIEFYKSCLSNVYELFHVDTDDQHFLNYEMEALICIDDEKCWDFDKHPDYPILYVMNGGVVLDQDHLYSCLNQVESTDVLIVNCKSDVLILRNMFGEVCPEIQMLPLPVNTCQFRPMNKLNCRTKLPLEGVDFVLGFVGRLLPQKNLHIFLRMIHEIKKAVFPKKIAALINGKFWMDYPILPYVTSEYPENIKKLIQELDLYDEVLYFPGGFDDEELVIFYNSLDLLVHPTNYIDENFGYAPVKAMACGVPVIGAAYGGLKDTVLSNSTGFLMDTWVTEGGIRMNVASGINMALKLLGNKDLYEEFSQNAIRHVRKNFSSENCSDILVNIVKNCIENKARCSPKKVILKPRKTVNASINYLPSTEKAWDSYKEVVSYYTSISNRLICKSDYVQTARPLKINKDSCILRDDAWPAKYPVNDIELKVVKKCINGIKISDLIFLLNVNLEMIKNMVNIGLLNVYGKSHE